jgi:hypothetical protein
MVQFLHWSGSADTVTTDITSAGGECGRIQVLRTSGGSGGGAYENTPGTGIWYTLLRTSPVKDMQ